MINLTNEQLVEEYLNGDSQALEFLIQRNLNDVYNFSFNYVKNEAEADDLTQEIFVKVWKNIKKFNSQYKFRTWLFTIAKNTCLDFLKKNKRTVNFSELDNDETDFNFSESLADKSPSILKVLQNQGDFEALNLALESLPKSYQATLDLRYDQGLKFREIAELLGVSMETIKTRNRRGIEMLKKKLKL